MPSTTRHMSYSAITWSLVGLFFLTQVLNSANVVHSNVTVLQSTSAAVAMLETVDGELEVVLRTNGNSVSGIVDHLTGVKRIRDATSRLANSLAKVDTFFVGETTDFVQIHQFLVLDNGSSRGIRKAEANVHLTGSLLSHGCR